MSTPDPLSFERRFIAFLDTMADEVPDVRYRAPRTMLRRAQARLLATTAAGVMLAAALASGGVLVGRALHGGGPVPGFGGTTPGGFVTTGSNGSSGAAGSRWDRNGGVTVGGVPGTGYLAPFGPSGFLGQDRRGPDGGGWDRRPLVPGTGGGHLGSGDSPGSKQGSPNGGSSGSSGSSGGGFWWNPPGTGTSGGDTGIGLLSWSTGGSGSSAGISAGDEVGHSQDAPSAGAGGSSRASRPAPAHGSHERQPGS